MFNVLQRFRVYYLIVGAHRRRGGKERGERLYNTLLYRTAVVLLCTTVAALCFHLALFGLAIVTSSELIICLDITCS